MGVRYTGLKFREKIWPRRTALGDITDHVTADVTGMDELVE